MSIQVDSNRATSEMLASLGRVEEGRAASRCVMEREAALVLGGRNCLTYQYVMLTAIVAKAADERVDVLSLQVEDDSAGAYSPRQLCKAVVYPFQHDMLDNVLDGSNNDPLVNKPARYPRLRRSNAARGDGRVALEALCEGLPRVRTSDDARGCLDWVMGRLVAARDARRREAERVREAVAERGEAGTVVLRRFLSDLLGQGYGGDALVLVASALYRIQYPESDGWKVVPHPVNQSGASRRQFSDLDLMREGRPFMGTELKDRPFGEEDVRRAAQTACSAGARSLMFVAGRQSRVSSQVRSYFDAMRAEFASQGFYVGIVDIDSLMDMVLAAHPDAGAGEALQGVYDQVRTNGGTPEEQLWVYRRVTSREK